MQAAGAASIGTYSYTCGPDMNAQGGVDMSMCSNLFVINGCSIAQVGNIDADYTQLGTGVWSVGPATKGCPKASAYQELAFDSVLDQNDMYWEQYTFTVSHWIGRVPKRLFSHTLAPQPNRTIQIKGSRTPLNKRN